MWFGDLVQNVQGRPSANGVEQAPGRNALHAWIRSSIAGASPTTRWSGSSSRGTGDSFVNGAANFWVRNLTTMGVTQDNYDNVAAVTGKKFLGMQINCSGCHNGAGHLRREPLPLQEDADGLLEERRVLRPDDVTRALDAGTAQNKYVLSDNTTGAYLLNTTRATARRVARRRTAQQGRPGLLPDRRDAKSGKPPRAEFARMLTAHPQFARAAVNYIWREMFGARHRRTRRRFRPPTASTRDAPARTVPAGQPPRAPRAVSRPQFAAGGFDLRSLLRTDGELRGLPAVRALHAGPLDETYTRYFARRITRRMTPSRSSTRSSRRAASGRPARAPTR